VSGEHGFLFKGWLPGFDVFVSDALGAGPDGVDRELDAFCNRSMVVLLAASSSAGFALLFVVAAKGATFWAVRSWV
jgi:hypothetical protein